MPIHIWPTMSDNRYMTTYSGDDNYDDEIASGSTYEWRECDDCYPFECRDLASCSHQEHEDD